MFYLQLENGATLTDVDLQKTKDIALLINQHPGREIILVQMAQASPLVLSQNLRMLDLQSMAAMLSAQFS
jgi:hypothetical protein